MRVAGHASREGEWRATPRMRGVAGLTGLEPATFRVTGGRSNQLSYNPKEEKGHWPRWITS